VKIKSPNYYRSRFGPWGWQQGRKKAAKNVQKRIQKGKKHGLAKWEGGTKSDAEEKNAHEG